MTDARLSESAVEVPAVITVADRLSQVALAAVTTGGAPRLSVTALEIIVPATKASLSETALEVPSPLPRTRGVSQTALEAVTKQSTPQLSATALEVIQQTWAHHSGFIGWGAPIDLRSVDVPFWEIIP